jgi:hypothetical protein
VKRDTKMFRTVRWQIAAAGAFCLGCLVALGVAISRHGGSIAIAVCSVLTLAALAAFAHALTTRIALKAHGLEVVANFRRRFLPREIVETVTWEHGGGVSVKLVDGTWLKLPETGHNSHVRAESIRVWLKQTRAGTSSARRRSDA